MDFFLGAVVGFVLGFGFLFLTYHKSVISAGLHVVKDDISTLHAKIDKLFHSLQK